MTDKELYKLFNGKKTVEPLLELGNLTAELKNKFSLAFSIVKNEHKERTVAVEVMINDKTLNRFILPPQGARRLRDNLTELL